MTDLKQAEEVLKKMRYYVLDRDTEQKQALSTVLQALRALSEAEVPKAKEIAQLGIDPPNPIEDIKNNIYNATLDACRPLIAKRDMEIEELKKQIEQYRQVAYGERKLPDKELEQDQAFLAFKMERLNKLVNDLEARNLEDNTDKIDALNEIASLKNAKVSNSTIEAHDKSAPIHKDNVSSDTHLDDYVKVLPLYDYLGMRNKIEALKQKLEKK